MVDYQPPSGLSLGLLHQQQQGQQQQVEVVAQLFNGHAVVERRRGGREGQGYFLRPSAAGLHCCGRPLPPHVPHLLLPGDHVGWMEEDVARQHGETRI